MLDRLIGALLGRLTGGNRGPKVHRRSSKIDKVNKWKAGKKVSGNWLPHDEYVKRKRGR